MQLILLAAPAFFALLFFITPTIRGKSPRHFMLHITKPEGPLNRNGSPTEHVHVQEKGEFRLLKLIAVAAGIPFYWLDLEPVFIALVAQIVTMMLVNAFAGRIPAVDYAGHGAEIISAEADGFAGYFEIEAERMSTRDRDKQGQDVRALLKRWNWLARIVFMLGRW